MKTNEVKEIQEIQDILLRYLRKEEVSKEEEDRLFQYYEEHRFWG